MATQTAQITQIRGSYSRATGLIGLGELVREHGGNLTAYLDEAGIDGRALSDVDMLISFPAYTAVLEIAANRLDLPYLGLELALRAPPEFPHLGPVVLIANMVEDLGAFVDAALKYWPLHTNGATIRVLRDVPGGLSACRCHIDAFVLPGRQYTEFALASICRLAQTVTGRFDSKPEQVRFQHRRLDRPGPYDRLFGCPVEFGAEHNELLFDSAMLRYPTRGRLKLLKPLVDSYVGLRVERMNRYDQSLTTAVALAIPSIVGTGQCNAEFIAEALRMNAKTLQRQLAREGTTFSDILDRVRYKMAQHMLVESGAAVGRIARLLDYSSTGPFTTAFRRWSGVSPLQYRKQGRMRVQESGWDVAI